MACSWFWLKFPPGDLRCKLQIQGSQQDTGCGKPWEPGATSHLSLWFPADLGLYRSTFKPLLFNTKKHPKSEFQSPKFHLSAPLPLHTLWQEPAPGLDESWEAQPVELTLRKSYFPLESLEKLENSLIRASKHFGKATLPAATPSCLVEAPAPTWEENTTDFDTSFYIHIYIYIFVPRLSCQQLSFHLPF